MSGAVTLGATARLDVILHARYTVATVPAASKFLGGSVYVSDGAAGNPVMAFSNGTDWLRCDTLAAISDS